MTATRPLRIGYLWQIENADLNKRAATPLHIKAIVGSWQRRGHQVRLVSRPAGRYRWTDDLVTWRAADPGHSTARPFRLAESAIRGVQSRLQLPYFNLFESYRFAQAAAAALAGFDILYERYWLLNSGGLIVARRLGLPLVLEVNGDLFEEYRQLNLHLSPVQWAAIRLINRRLFQGADQIITVSEPLRQRTIEQWGLDPARVTTVNNGAEVEMFANPGDVTAVRARYHLNGGPIIMFVGTFKPWHGLDLLLDAFSVVVAAQPAAKLMLVGDGPQREAIEQQAKALGVADSVVFTGAVAHQEVAALLGSSQIAVVNPRISGASISQSPLKLFEYMAAGKAIVAPDTPNIQQIISHRQTGLLVPPNDASALANALLSCMEDVGLRTALGQAAQHQALTRHSWGRAAAEIESIFYRLLDY